MAGSIPDEFLDLMAGKFRMLADPSRLAILRALMAGEKNVGQVVEESGRGQANVSKHLKLLAEAGLVDRRRDGMQVFYRITDPLVNPIDLKLMIFYGICPRPYRLNADGWVKIGIVTDHFVDADLGVWWEPETDRVQIERARLQDRSE